MSITPSRVYVDAVVREYVSLPGTPQRASRQDRRVAASLWEREVPLPVVRTALVMAVARRTLRSSRLPPLPPIRTLHYFLDAIEEVLDIPPEPGYVEYLECTLKRYAGQKAALAGER